MMEKWHLSYYFLHTAFNNKKDAGAGNTDIMKFYL